MMDNSQSSPYHSRLLYKRFPNYQNENNDNNNNNNNNNSRILTLNDISSNNDNKKNNIDNSNNSRNINKINNSNNINNKNKNNYYKDIINNNEIKDNKNNKYLSEFQNDELFRRSLNKKPSVTNLANNILKSEEFPMLSSNWESSKYSNYLNFRTFYVDIKSKKYILIHLSFLVLSLLFYYFIYYTNLYYSNRYLYYFTVMLTTLILGYSSYGIKIHFEKVPEVKMTEDERVLYDWPSNFPSSPNSCLSPIKPTQQQQLQQQQSQQQITTPQKSNLDQFNSISPIHNNNNNNNNNPQPLDVFISSFSSYDQFIKAKELVSSTTPNNAPFSSQFGRSTVINQNNNNKSFEDIERERMNYNFKGRLQTSITDFSFDKDSVDANNISTISDENDENNEQHYGSSRVPLIDDVKPVLLFTQPITYKKPAAQQTVVRVKTYEEVVQNKNYAWIRYIEDNHFYAITNCVSRCKRWFTINIISQLVEPAESFLRLKEDLQNQQIQEEQSKPFTKFNYDNNMNNPLDIMKSILKNVQYNLNSINDIHHKRESAYICQRIVDLSKDKFVFQEFGRGGNNWMDQYPTDEQLLFCLFCAYMDHKLYRDITAPNPDIPFSSKYIKFEDSRYINPISPMFSVAFKRPLHLDLLLPGSNYNQTIEISPGFDNLFFGIVLFFYNILKYQNGYLEGFNVELLNIVSFVQPLLCSNTYTSQSDDEDDF